MHRHCDNRNVASSGKFAKIAVTLPWARGYNRAMAIDGAWIKERLTGAHGEKARLAEALGVKQDVVSKILSGTRRLSNAEADAARLFFGEGPINEEERSMLALYRQASKDRQGLAVQFLRLLAVDDEGGQAAREKAGE